jgi:hypothetical protein
MLMGDYILKFIQVIKKELTPFNGHFLPDVYEAQGRSQRIYN